MKGHIPNRAALFDIGRGRSRGYGPGNFGPFRHCSRLNPLQSVEPVAAGRFISNYLGLGETGTLFNLSRKAVYLERRIGAGRNGYLSCIPLALCRLGRIIASNCANLLGPIGQLTEEAYYGTQLRRSKRVTSVIV